VAQSAAKLLWRQIDYWESKKGSLAAGKMFWSRKPKPSIFDGVPGPSPWYVMQNGPHLPGFKWNRAGETEKTAGVVVLCGSGGAVLALNFHNYVYSLDQDTVLIWHQQYRPQEGPTDPVVLRLFRYREMEPLVGSLDEVCSAMKNAGLPFASSKPPFCEISIPTVVAGEKRRLMFPDELRGLKELLVLCHSSGIDDSVSWERNNIALLVARPAHGTYQLYPQDWFNGGEFDYGYEWITRVARNSQTGKVHGEGIRIRPFVLDDSLRKLAK
jgi:hypothetical protein